MRFVIQEHRTSEGTHWDLMLERAGALKTWSLESEPPDTGPFEIRAIQHFDHRLLYLDFEGEISGGRGSVRIHDGGAFEAEWSGERVRLKLFGQRLFGEFELEFRFPGQRSTWVFRRR
jgi:hypothetical protein